MILPRPGVDRFCCVRGGVRRYRLGWTVVVEYFPNSKVVRDDTLGVTTREGIAWIPAFAGIASVIALRGGERISTAASVRFPAVPAGAITVFIFAGSVLFGGAGWSLVRLFEHQPKDDGDLP